MQAFLVNKGYKEIQVGKGKKQKKGKLFRNRTLNTRTMCKNDSLKQCLVQLPIQDIRGNFDYNNFFTSQCSDPPPLGLIECYHYTESYFILNSFLHLQRLIIIIMYSQNFYKFTFSFVQCFFHLKAVVSCIFQFTVILHFPLSVAKQRFEINENHFRVPHLVERLCRHLVKKVNMISLI